MVTNFQQGGSGKERKRERGAEGKKPAAGISPLSRAVAPPSDKLEMFVLEFQDFYVPFFANLIPHWRFPRESKE